MRIAAIVNIMRDLPNVLQVRADRFAYFYNIDGVEYYAIEHEEE